MNILTHSAFVPWEPALSAFHHPRATLKNDKGDVLLRVCPELPMGVETPPGIHSGRSRPTLHHVLPYQAP